MLSHFAWVDFTSENQEKMLDLVKLFQEKDTRDELGIGTIRDAFSEYFFPGTSTIQTRARYMLFVPWIYRNLLATKIEYPDIVERAAEDERKLIYALLESGENEGVIGRDALDGLQRLPSSIYWAGLYSWGIRLLPISIDQYLRGISSNYSNGSQSQKAEEYWDPGLPEAPDNLLEKTEMALKREEGEYLLHRISCTHPDSLLYYIIINDESLEGGFFWHLSVVDKLSGKMRINIEHAQNFSETIYGSLLLYNYLLSKEINSYELINKYIEMINDWVILIENRYEELLNWYNDLRSFWSSEALIEVNIKDRTVKFVEDWLDIVFENKGELKSIIDNSKAEKLIRYREYSLKDDRARLWNKRSREMWQGASGTVRLDYRWKNARIIVSDIKEALGRQGE